MSYFVGLDVSLDETAICIVDDAGVIFREGKADTEPEAIATWLKAAEVPIERLGLEAGPLSPWLCEGLRAAGLPAICIETRRMKGATAVMAVKTDRNDARAIAQAMRVGWFTAVHVKTAESQELRLLLTNRKTLQTSRVSAGERNSRHPQGIRSQGRPRVDCGIRGAGDRAHSRPAAIAGDGETDAGGAPGAAAAIRRSPRHGAQGGEDACGMPPAAHRAGCWGGDRVDLCDGDR